MKKGMVLISILMVTVVLIMLASTLVLISSQNLGFTNMAENRTAALKVAEAGVAYAIYCLSEDSNWQPFTKETVPMMKIPGRFEFTFDPNADYHSVNNLASGTAGGGWGGVNVPGYSVDLIVTGILDRGNTKVVKRIRVILQRNFYCPGSFSSGQTLVDANTLDIRKEVTPENNSQAGNIHSNSVKQGGNYAIQTDFSNVLLNGGIASADGDINIINLDTGNNSSIDPVKQSKNVTPIDIAKILEKAKNTVGSQISLAQKTTCVIYKDHVEVKRSDGSPVGWNLPPFCQVTGGQLHIKNNLYCAGNNNELRFEFDYSYADKTNPSYDPNVDISRAGIYLDPDPNTGLIPSVYIDNGDLTAAGALRGNGAWYVGGEANFIGESNIVAPDDTGVAVITSKDLYMELPSCKKKQLNLDVTGLVYSHGNINMGILSLTDKTNPKNNLVAGQWPPDWEDTVLAGTNVPIQTLNLSDLIFPVNDSANNSIEHINYSNIATTITSHVDGTYDITIPPGSNIVAKIKINGIVVDFPISSSPSDPNSLATNFPDDLSGDPGWPSNWKDIIKGLLAKSFNGENVSQGDPNAKIDPDFHIKGGIVAIDPNNPVPSLSKPDSNNSGNIKINMNKGKFFLVSSKKYLKLLESAKAPAGSFKIITWSEI